MAAIWSLERSHWGVFFFCFFCFCFFFKVVVCFIVLRDTGHCKKKNLYSVGSQYGARL